MHARNTHQVLGADLKIPSLFVVCWTKDGQLKGGTAQALRLADLHSIPIYNLGAESLQCRGLTPLRQRLSLLSEILSNLPKES